MTITCLLFYGNGSDCLVSGSWGGQIILWDVVGKRMIHVFNDGIEAITKGLHVWKEKNVLISFNDDGIMKFWDIAKKMEIGTITDGKIVYTAISNDGIRIAVGFVNHKVEIWNVLCCESWGSDYGKIVYKRQRLFHKGDGLRTLAMNKDGTVVGCGTNDGVAMHKSVDGGEYVHLYDIGCGICDMMWIINSRHVITRSYDSYDGTNKWVKVWDYVEGKCLETIDGSKSKWYGISDDGRVGFGINKGIILRDINIVDVDELFGDIKNAAST